MTVWGYNDGGRAAAGYKGSAGDCVVRAIAIAAQEDYAVVYDDLRDLMHSEPKLARGKRSPRDGVPTPLIRRYLEDRNWTWTPTMHIGSGCTVHVRRDELPFGRLVLRLSGHVAAFIDGVLEDTYDSSRDGTRCVYGYWTAP